MPKTRDASLDIAKGVAIVLIVSGHVLRGLSADLIVHPASWCFIKVDTALYLVHLPTFAFLSGLFVERSVAKRGAGHYLLNRAIDFGWLYVLWTLAQGAVKIATSSLVNTPTGPKELLTEFVRPASQMWYLPSLFSITFVAVALRVWAVPVVATFLAAIASLGSWGHPGEYVGSMGWGLFIFFVVAAAFGLSTVARAMSHRATALAAVPLLTAFAALVFLTKPAVPTAGSYGPGVISDLWGVLGATVGTVGVLALSKLLSLAKALSRLFSFLGQRSMEIFLAHIVFSSAARIALKKLGVVDTATQLSVGIIVGIVAPLALWWIASRLGMNWLFSTPDFLKSLGRAIAPKPEYQARHLQR